MRVIEHRRRRLNVRLLLVLLCGTGLLAAGLSVLHDRQVRAASAILLQRGLAAQQAGNHRLAVDELGRYVEFVPEDSDGLKAYVRSLRQLSQRVEVLEQVYALNDEILRRRPAESAVREVQADLALRLGRVPDAASHVDVLERHGRLNGPLWFIRARCLESQHAIDEAIAAYQTVLQLEPDHLGATERLADLLDRRKHDPAAAEALVAQLVRNTASVEALLLRGRRHLVDGKADQALRDFRQAATLDPKSTAAVVAFAGAVQRQCLQLGSRTGATEALRREAVDLLSGCVQATPQDAGLRLRLAALLWFDDDSRTQAIEVLQNGVALDPENGDLLFSLANSLVSVGDVESARRLLPRFGPDPPARARRNLVLGRALMAGKQWQQARTVLQRVHSSLRTEPELLRRVQVCLAECARELKDAEGSAKQLQETARRHPEDSRVRLALAEALLLNDQTASAISEYRRMKAIPGVAAFLADLLIESQAAARIPDWTEAADLVAEDSAFILDPVERGILAADLRLAQGRTSQAWQLLLRLQSDSPESEPIALAIERLTAALLDRVMQAVSGGRTDPAATAAWQWVHEYWSRREDVVRLLEYMQQYIGGSGERNETLRRMRAAVVVTTELALSLPQGREEQREQLLEQAGRWSVRLVQLQPHLLPAHGQWLLRTGQEQQLHALLSDTQQPTPEIAGATFLAAIPMCHGRENCLRMLDQQLGTWQASFPNTDLLDAARAELLCSRERYDAAAQAWRALLQRSPDCRVARTELAWLLAVHFGQPGQALKVLQPELDRSPDDPQLDGVRACIHIAAGEFSYAEKMLNQALFQSPHLSHFVYLAYTQLKMGKVGDAASAVRAVSRMAWSRQQLRPLDRHLLEGVQSSLPPSE